jgi:hypothetical protein
MRLTMSSDMRSNKLISASNRAKKNQAKKQPPNSLEFGKTYSKGTKIKRWGLHQKQIA